MNNSFFKSIILTFIFVTSLFASNEEINQKLFELKKSQEYAQELNDEKITLIMGQIIQKENEIKDLEKKLKNYVNKEDLQREINYQNNRIEDINSSVDSLSIIVSVSIGLFGILITAIVIFFAFRFERIARVQADKEVKNWIDEKADKEFKPRVDSYLAQIDDRAKKLFEKNEGLTQKLEDKLELLDKYTEEEKKELEEEAQEIKSSKNERDYTFEDKYKLFISKYVKRDYEEALNDLNTLLGKEDLNRFNLLKILLAKAMTLGKLDRNEEKVKVYDEVVKRFEDSKENNILEKVSKALYNKGISLGQLNKSEEAIEVYDEVVKRFEDSKENNILEKVSKALYNKGISLGELNKNEEEIEVYDEVVKRFKDSKDSSILEQVSKALYNKGVRLGQMGKSEEAIEVYDEVVKRFEDSKDNSILEQVAKALVNKKETNLILNKANSKEDLELFFKLSKNNKNELIMYKMLTILERAKDFKIDNKIEEWKKEFKDTSIIENWSFSELKDWANSFEDKEVKERLLRYIDIFENHNKK
ncbi:tetratricopeptide repeat protein [Malaciobacter marinus]|uniref:tetratricopeptide repeat protein n=1 Tax=Malaciobacter marinus TaxID=505249 RepID=UPI003B004466